MERLRKNAALGRPRAGEKENMCALALKSIPKTTRGPSLKQEKLAVEKSSKLQEDSDLFQELWSKFRWSIGSTLKTTYTKRSGVGDIARMLARSCASLEYQGYLEGGHDYRVQQLQLERSARDLMKHEPDWAKVHRRKYAG